MSKLMPPIALPSRRRYRLWLPFGAWVLLAAGVGIVLLQALLLDSGMANGLTWVVLMAAGVLLLPWFTFFSYYSRAVRWTVFGAALVGAGLFMLCCRVESFNANMWPKFVLRDWLRGILRMEIHLPPPVPSEAATNAAVVDLIKTTPFDFPRFLGPNGDLSVSVVKLDRDWTAHPPQELWRQPIGAGWSGFAIVHGNAVTMEQRKEVELVTCYEVHSGKLLWSHGTTTRFATLLAGVGPRATPTIYQGRVYTLGATGILSCLEGATGKPVWIKNVPKEFDMTPADEESLVRHGRANSPLIVDDRVIIPAGGPRKGPQFSLAAFHQDNGALIWKGGDHNVSYATPVLTELAGVRQILSVNENEVSGHDAATGVQLWSEPWPGITSENANVSQPIPVPPDKVFVSKGYGGGAKLFQLLPKGDGTFDTNVIYHKPRSMRTKLTNAAVKDGYVYGLSDGVLECMKLETGKVMWRDGAYGHGQILLVNDLLLVLSEDGGLVLVEASPERGDNVLGRMQALEGQTWNNLALSGPYLLVRNAKEAACYQLSVK